MAAVVEEYGEDGRPAFLSSNGSSAFHVITREGFNAIARNGEQLQGLFAKKNLIIVGSEGHLKTLDAKIFTELFGGGLCLKNLREVHGAPICLRHATSLTNSSRSS